MERNIFRTSPTLTQKIATLMSLLVTMLAGCSFLGDILVDEQLMRQLIWIALSIALLWSGFFFFAFTNKNSYLRKNIRQRRANLVYTILSTAVAVPLFIYPAATRGAPILIHSIFASEDYMHFTINKKAITRYSNRCDTHLYLTEQHHFMNARLCQLTQPRWHRLKPGEQFSLSGELSAVGFTFHSEKSTP